jgi:hypothetical protein
MISAREKELKAPGPCGKHPKHYWMPDGFLNGEPAHCVLCAETAKLQAEIAERPKWELDYCDRIAALKAEIAELRAGAAVVMEKALAECDAVRKERDSGTEYAFPELQVQKRIRALIKEWNENH